MPFYMISHLQLFVCFHSYCFIVHKIKYAEMYFWLAAHSTLGRLCRRHG